MQKASVKFLLVHHGMDRDIHGLVCMYLFHGQNNSVIDCVFTVKAAPQLV